MLDKVRRNTAKAEELRKVLKSIYSKQEYADKINDLADEQVLELCDNLRRGVPMATPVFDGAHEPDIVAMLEKAGLDKSGQVTPLDGRTGAYFERKGTHGSHYMMKVRKSGEKGEDGEGSVGERGVCRI